MRIAVNTRFLIKNRLEGIGWFTYETMKRLVQRHPEHEFVFLFDRDFPNEFIFADNVIGEKVWPPARHPYLWQFWFDYSIPRILERYNPDLFISTDGFMSTKTHLPTLLVLHDLGFEHYPEHTPQIVSRYYRKYTPVFAHKADKIITVSDFTKQDIISQYNIEPSKIDVIFNGASDVYKPLNTEQQIAVRQKYTSGKPYFIYVGSVHPRKNIKNLLLAYDQFQTKHHTDYKLVIAGRMAWKTDATKAAFENMHCKEDVIFTGHLQLPELAKLMGGAEALIYPSLFEGFGIPVLEARYCNVPIISSNRSSLPEVAGENALYFNPENIEEMVAAIEKFYANHFHYKTLASTGPDIRNTFSWDASVTRMEQTIAEMDKRFKPGIVLQ